MLKLHQGTTLGMAMILSGCVTGAIPKLSTVASFLAPADMTPALPEMRWDHREEADEWTAATIAAVAAYDTELAASVPYDIATWCPGYAKADIDDRRAFWSGLLSAVAKYESSWNPRASGGGGRYLGLMQISPKTAVNYGCDATSAAALKDGTENLSCAVDILAYQVGRDDVVAGNGKKGIGRDWRPLRSASKRAEIAGWTSSQAYCQ
jgi:soluble lytic murein transglycosylase-like protein